MQCGLERGNVQQEMRYECEGVWEMKDRKREKVIELELVQRCDEVLRVE